MASEGLMRHERNDKIETLLRKDDEMVREVKKLDSDMQMLVYENYNKFISATDTIRKMAQNVEGMETEMTDLKSSMDRIADSSAAVNSSLEGNRSKMDKLVRVRRLLQRLDFLFQLPQKLEEAVEEGQYAKAIRYFSMTKDILRKHSHVSSFGAIQRDCENTVKRLQEKLQEEVNSSDVSRDTLVSHADLLLKLGVDPAGLKDRYLEAHKQQLCAFLEGSKGALVEDRSVSLDACLGKLAEGFLPMLLRTVQLYDQLFQPSKVTQSPPAAGATEQPASSKQPEQGGTGGESATNGKTDDPQQTHKGLVSLVQSSVDSFFGLLHAKVDQSLDASGAATTADGGGGGGGDQQTPQGGGGGGGEGGGGGRGGGGERGGVAAATGELELDPVALGGVVAAVQQLVTDIETVDPHIPQVQLARRAKDFAQEFKRGQVRRSFRVLCRSSLSVATAMVHAVRAGVPPQDILADAPDSGYSGGSSSSSRHGSNSMSSSRRRRVGAGGAGEGQQYPALVDRALEILLKGADEIVSGLRPLSRLDSTPGPLAEELRFGLWGVMLWLASALGIVAGVTADASSCDTLPSVEGREYNNRALEEEWANGAVSALREPLPVPETKEAVAAAVASAAAAAAEAAETAGVGDGGGKAGATDGEVALLLACLCRGLGTTFVVRVPEILGRQIPLTLDQSVHAPPPSMHFSGSMHSTRSASSTLKSVGATAGAAGPDDGGGGGDDDSASASVGGGSGGGGGPPLGRRRQLDAVRHRVSAAALVILEHYAETAGRRLADVLEVGLDGPPGGGGDWFEVEEPAGVGEAVLDALEVAEDNVKEVCAFLGEARAGTVSVTRSGERDLRRGSTSLLSGGRNGMKGIGGGVGGVRRDIDRIFEGSGSGGGVGTRGSSGGAARVSFAADSMLAAVFRVALKAFGERARFLTLPGPGFRQVHLDADFLRQVLPYYVAESQMLSSLDNLLDQALQSAADRSLDPTPMDPAAAGDIVAQALDGFKYGPMSGDENIEKQHVSFGLEDGGNGPRTRPPMSSRLVLRYGCPALLLTLMVRVVWVLNGDEMKGHRRVTTTSPPISPAAQTTGSTNRCSDREFTTSTFDKGRTCGSPLSLPCFNYSRCAMPSPNSRDSAAGSAVSSAGLGEVSSPKIYVYDADCSLSDSDSPSYNGQEEGLIHSFQNAAREAGVLAATYGSACVFVHVSRADNKPCAVGTPLWNSGMNHMMVNFGDQGREGRTSVADSYAMDAASNMHSCVYRSGYDVSLPLNPKKTSRDLAETEYCERIGQGYDNHDYGSLMNTTFGLIPSGRQPSTFRLGEVMGAGAIPVMVARDVVLPFREQLDWPSFSLAFAPDQVGPDMISALREVPRLQLEEMQRKSLEAYKWMFGEDDTLWGGPDAYGPTATNVINILLDRIGHRGGR
eukprot:g2975.t1